MLAHARSAVLFFVLLSALAAAAFAADSQDVDFQWSARVPMRDGVTLSATIFRPAGQKEPLPVIFTLTPYIADSYEDRALYFARHGYVYALVDVRGRGDSEGVFDPFAQEARDGYDAVEWLARQPWSNGKVAMWGGSYAGFDQWTTAKELPPHLATIVPAAAVHPGVDFPFLKGIFYSYDMQWLTFTSGKAKNTLIFGDGLLWGQKFREMYLAHRPYRELDRIVGNPSPVFQRWLSHPTYDAYWQGMVPTPEQYAQLDLPVLTITGHFDGDQPGALTYYRAHMRYASPATRDRHYLIVGPWDHAGTRTPDPHVGGLTFDPASVLDLNALHKEWYDWTLKNGPRPSFLEKRVSYYETGPGAERWKRADTLEEIGATRRTFYLDGQAGDAFHSGRLAPAKPAGASAPDHYVYDPLDVRPGQSLEGLGDRGLPRRSVRRAQSRRQRRRLPQRAVRRGGRGLRTGEALPLDVARRPRHRLPGLSLRDPAERQQHLPHLRLPARPLPGFRADRVAGAGRTGGALRLHRLLLVLPPDLEGKPAAPGDRLAQLPRRGEELQLGRRGGRRDREGRPHGPRDPLSRRRASERAGDPGRAVSGLPAAGPSLERSYAWARLSRQRPGGISTGIMERRFLR